jgi:MoxR-like ATPase
VQATRSHPALRHGLSPRAGLALRRAAQAWALLEGRSGVIPEDVQAVFAAVVNHRLVTAADRMPGGDLAAEILAGVRIP